MMFQAWASEFCHDDAEERAIVIGVAQTFGQAFIAWVPVVILNVGKYAPRFHLGFSVMSGISVLQFTMIFVLRFFVQRQTKQEELQKTRAAEADVTGEQNRAYESESEASRKRAGGIEQMGEVFKVPDVHDGKHWQR
jgi:ACS family pantothenate transporter-like MFS transporter